MDLIFFKFHLYSIFCVFFKTNINLDFFLSPFNFHCHRRSSLTWKIMSFSVRLFIHHFKIDTITTPKKRKVSF